MVLVKLKGGLGNQMFQYATGSILSNAYNTELKVDLSYLNRHKSYSTKRSFELKNFINIKEASKAEIHKFCKETVLKKIKRKLNINHFKIYKEKYLFYDEDILNYKSPVYLDGYFQSFKYLALNEKLVRKCFKFPVRKLDTYNKNILKNIISNKSVAIHVRRGDFLSNYKANNFHGLCSTEYYKKGIFYFSNKFKDCKFFIFSDDIDYVEKEFLFLNNKVIVKSDNFKPPWVDMFLMSQCESNIIANSTYSWWSAWLNKNEKKEIIAPLNWYKDKSFNYTTTDLIPHTWKRF